MVISYQLSVKESSDNDNVTLRKEEGVGSLSEDTRVPGDVTDNRQLTTDNYYGKSRICIYTLFQLRNFLALRS